MKLEYLAKIYAKAILEGDRTIDDVPDAVKEMVEDILKENNTHA